MTLVAIEDNHPPKDDWLRVEWNLGRRCNYDCSYCGPLTHDNSSEHMSIENFNSTIEQLTIAGRAQGKKVKISLTGGEPFVHPRILDMLASAKQKGIFKISVTTNGSVPLKKYEAAIEFIDYFIISYHFEFAYHDKVINTMIGLDALCKQRSNKKMHVHLMFLPGYLEQCKEIIDTLNANEITYAVRRIRPQYNGSTGELLRPHASGSLGTIEHQLQVAIKPNQIPYYSEEELAWLATV